MLKWILIVIALIYLLSPIDIIPGLNPVGWLDDIVVMVLLYRYLSRFWRSRATGQPPFGNSQNQSDQSGTQTEKSSHKKNRTAHEILGVPPTADQKAIRSAYRELANQYHPDKVAHLGEEFQTLAEERFKEIQEAYDKLNNS